MEFPTDRAYAETHVWVKMDRDEATLGLSAYAAHELGEIDYVELPEQGTKIVKHRAFALVETSKAATDLVAPLSGTISAVNVLLHDAPRTVNTDPYGTGWLIRLVEIDRKELSDLLTSEAYASTLPQDLDRF